MKKPRVAFETLGCKANFFDTQQLQVICERLGFQIVPFSSEADAYVVNTCTVTAHADHQGRQALRRAHRQNPLALVIATGCTAQISPQSLERIEGVDAVFGTQQREEVIRYLAQSFLVTDAPPSTFDESVPLSQDRARAYLKIQDGCNFRCAYCAIWKARGKSRSRPVALLVDDVHRLVDAGYEEVIITGIHIGSYGRDLQGQPKLSHLLQEIYAKTSVRRIRLSSLDPECLDPDLLELFLSEKRLARHLHLSLQSASDSVLRLMRRRTKSADAKRIIEALTENSKGFFIAADIMVGFPGETEEDFKRTHQFLEELSFAWLHVFPFSARPETVAETMSAQVAKNEIQRRARLLTSLAHAKREKFYQSQIGETLPVIVTSKQKDEEGFLHGISDNNVPILYPDTGARHGASEEVLIERVHDGKVYGRCQSLQKKKNNLRRLKSSFTTAFESERILSAH